MKNLIKYNCLKYKKSLLKYLKIQKYNVLINLIVLNWQIYGKILIKLIK